MILTPSSVCVFESESLQYANSLTIKPYHMFHLLDALFCVEPLQLTTEVSAATVTHAWKARAARLSRWRLDRD